MALKKHGITADTLGNIMLGAGTIYKNLAYDYTVLAAQPADWATNYTNYYTRTGTAGSYVYAAVTGATAPEWAANTYYELDWNGTQLGATNGGITFTYEPEYLDVEVDGATVAVKGLTKQKVAETASIKGAMTEVTEGVVVDALHLTEDTTKSVVGVHTCYTTKSNITANDYLTNIAYVGFTSSDKKIIIILPNAICISAFEIQGQNKTQATYEVEFTCTGTLESGDLNKLPLEIYFPDEAV